VCRSERKGDVVNAVPEVLADAKARAPEYIHHRRVAHEHPRRELAYTSCDRQFLELAQQASRGVVTLRDLAARAKEPPRAAVTTVSAGASIAEAARALASENLHHLVVVGATGEAIGILSSLDVVRGLLGLPARHPATTTRFPAAPRE
jgi:CBS-domain-containing membrane protein